MNPFPGRRRTIQAVKTMAKPEPVVEQVVEEPKEEPPVSFKGLSKCPKCGKEMKRGLPMHYKHCKAS